MSKDCFFPQAYLRLLWLYILVGNAGSLDKNSKSTKSSSAPHLGDEEQQAIRAGAHDLFMELDFYSSEKWKEGFRPRTGSGGPNEMR